MRPPTLQGKSGAGRGLTGGVAASLPGLGRAAAALPAQLRNRVITRHRDQTPGSARRRSDTRVTPPRGSDSLGPVLTPSTALPTKAKPSRRCRRWGRGRSYPGPALRPFPQGPRRPPRGSPSAQPRHVAERRGHAQERLLLLVHDAGDDEVRGGRGWSPRRETGRHRRPRLRCRKRPRAPRHRRPGSRARDRHEAPPTSDSPATSGRGYGTETRQARKRERPLMARRASRQPRRRCKGDTFLDTPPETTKLSLGSPAYCVSSMHFQGDLPVPAGPMGPLPL